ncbi:MAG: hypothetical protein LBF12_01005 [Christensenellaceae bacterium]|jgi:hypothetical protein|nr:hypothetical protein [Christensenellaceae bacterium]
MEKNKKMKRMGSIFAFIFCIVSLVQVYLLASPERRAARLHGSAMVNLKKNLINVAAAKFKEACKLGKQESCKKLKEITSKKVSK